MNFEDYLNRLKNSFATKRDELCRVLGNMPHVTFRYKVRNNSFSPLEQEKIAETLKEDIKVLFPTAKKTA
ncbi:hypothetical protein OU798_07650 [Prolixibacteraceae bacterium Z1-6]|uniref:Uncharacterized protein n=1 Tax=Draconibacterium aestuarii TaxID=2998507 RepID=A0A9X3F5I7_9BACT|nr:hypothetical protein [Prolixibacteraceae bacterium Z1-6]